jgi:hypothetical protein
MNLVRAEIAGAVRAKQLRPDAESDDAVRLLTVVISGVMSQQMANQPSATYEEGLFSRLTDEAIDMWVAQYQARRRR